jgi:hypothetical protein
MLYHYPILMFIIHFKQIPSNKVVSFGNMFKFFVIPGINPQPVLKAGKSP